MMEFMDHESIRVKLEHSYSLTPDIFGYKYQRVVEEDPLRISPEDFTVKLEDEDIVIKQEELDDVDVNQSHECFNSPSVGEHFENHHAPTNNSMLLPHESDRSENEIDCLESENSRDVNSNKDFSISVNYEHVDMVPKHIFLEFQKKYEKTIADMENKSDKLTSLVDSLTKENAKIIQRPVAEPLSIENERLKGELRAAKVKEMSLIERMHARERSFKVTGKELNLLKEKCSSDANTKKKFLDEINELKQQLYIKETQVTYLRQKQNLLDIAKKDNSKLSDLNALYKTALEKAKEDLSVKAKELADSLRIREMLTERSIRLNKRLVEEGTLQYKRKFQKEHQDLRKSLKHSKDLQRSLDEEVRKNLYLAKERDQLLEESQVKYRQARAELVNAKQELASSRGLVNRKIEEANYLRAEARKLSGELLQKQLELRKKEEEWKGKVCEYCGL